MEDIRFMSIGTWEVRIHMKSGVWPGEVEVRRNKTTCVNLTLLPSIYQHSSKENIRMMPGTGGSILEHHWLLCLVSNVICNVQ